jgi:uncharacterized protein YjiS (DUF1127 family)
MNTTLHSTTTTTTTTANPPGPLLSTFGDALAALQAIARSIDAWLAARQRAAQDLDAFASMSERELRDIGMNRASTNFVALGGRIRDYPL